MQKYTCCFLGHREICKNEKLNKQLYSIIENLILNNNVDTFLFGSKSQFDRLCYEAVTKIKEKHPHIKRIYVRAEFPQIDESYKSYLLEGYEATYYPQKIANAGKAVYIERNQEMINKSKYCIIYYHAANLPKNATVEQNQLLIMQLKKTKKSLFCHNM